MTKVICNCIKCKYNKDKVCTKDVIILEESDNQWEDCDSSDVNCEVY